MRHTTRSIRTVIAVCFTASTALLAACSDRSMSPTDPTTPDASTSADLAPAVDSATLGAAVAKSTSASATITFEVRVKGYSNWGDKGWITVRSDCGGGGRIMRAGRTDACTDRVQRLEELRVRITSRDASRSKLTAIAGVTSSNGFTRAAFVPVPFSATFIVSSDATFDNVRVATVLLDGSLRAIGNVQERRVPIGLRPTN
jgi:hypothetical protein